MTIAILLVLGLAFMALEALTPSFGLLALGGSVSFFSALMMLHGQGTLFGHPVNMPLLIALGICGLVVLGFCAWITLRSFKKPVTSGPEMMIGKRARVIEWHDGNGRVHLDGEDWRADGPFDLPPDTIVRVTAIENLTLTVEKDFTRG